MAGPRHRQIVDQWRPEGSLRDDQIREPAAVAREVRGRSPAALARHQSPYQPYTRSHSRERSRNRGYSRGWSRSRSPSSYRDDDTYRPSRREDRNHLRDRSSSSSRHLPYPPSRPTLRRYSRSPRRDDYSSRGRDRSWSRDTSRSRDYDRGYSPAPTKSSYYNDRTSPRRRSPDTYVPPVRRRSRSPLSSSYRPAPDRRHTPSLPRHSNSRRGTPPAQRYSRRYSPSPELPARSNRPAQRYPSSRDEPTHPRSRKRSRRSPSPRSTRAASPANRPSSHRHRGPRESFSRSPTPPRKRRRSYSPEDNMRSSYHSYPRGGTPRPPNRPHVDTHYSGSPPYSHQTSPHGHSPYGHRGSWGPPPPPVPHHYGSPPYPPQQPYRQNSYPPPPSPHQWSPPPPPNYGGGSPYSQPPYHNQPYRGGYEHRGNHHSPPTDRRYSGPGLEQYPPANRDRPQRGRGHFSNLSWTPQTGSRGGVQIPPRSRTASQTKGDEEEEEDDPFRPAKDLRVEDEKAREAKETRDMPPPRPTSPPKSDAQNDSRIKFALKPKELLSAIPPTAGTSPRPREPTAAPKARGPIGSSEFDRRSSYDDRSGYDERRGYNERRGYEERRGYNDRRNYDDRRAYADQRDYDNERDYDDRREYNDRKYYADRHDYHHEERVKRYEEKDYTRQEEATYREPPRKEPRLVKRVKPKPTLPPEYASSNSVYYRKPGNESVVGSGTYGKVFRAIHVYTGDKVALKKIRMEGERDGFPVTAIREVKLLQSLNHENVVKLQEVMVEKNDCYMVFEYLSHDLTGLLNHPTFRLEHEHKKHLAKQLFEGLDYLHRRGVLHRDIKAANILISNTGQLKLADFGLARFFAKRRQLDYTNRVITIWYRSPELLLGETQYGPAVDIWSAACVLIEIFTKHAIFPGDGGEINQLDRIYNVLGTPTRTDWPAIVDMAWFELLRPSERKPSTFAEKYQERVTPEAFELLKTMFAFDPKKRPSAAEVLEHPYFISEEPLPRQALELKDLEGDWHEFESKALRKEKERVERDARKQAKEAEAKGEHKRRAEGEDAAVTMEEEREAKRPKLTDGGAEGIAVGDG